MAKAIFALIATTEAATLAVTWGDCGAKHATVDNLTPTTITTGGDATTLTGTGISDEDVTSAQFTAAVKASGVKVASCSGDATSDIVCKLPAGVGTITVKAVSFPLKAGRVNIPVDVKVSALIPASLAITATHIEAVDQNGESAICLDVNTKKAAEMDVTVEAATLAVSWGDCGAKHATVTDLSPTSITTGGAATTLTGTGTLDEDVTSATFTAVVKASGVKVASCSGDATSDIVCTLPAGVGTITVKAVSFPLKAGRVNIPVDVKVSSLIPASLATTSTHIEAVDQNGESVICLDVNTKKQAEDVVV